LFDESDIEPNNVQLSKTHILYAKTKILLHYRAKMRSQHTNQSLKCLQLLMVSAKYFSVSKFDALSDKRIL